MHNEPTITKKQLLEELKLLSDDCEISFGGLQFYRVKGDEDKWVKMEFNQSVYLNDEGKVVVENH